MQIWSDISLDWEGRTYTVRPTLELINALEQGEGRSLSKMLIRLSQSDLPSGLACELVAKTLKFAGAENATPEAVYMATGGIGEQICEMAASVIMACLPQPKEQLQGSDSDEGEKKS